MARPLKFTPDSLGKKIEEYFEKKAAEKGKLKYCSILNLCSFLGISWDTWNRYRKRPAFADITKKAEEKIFDVWQEQLFYPGRNSTGAIFYLKNRAGFADKVEHKHKATIEHEHTHKLDELPLQQLRQLNAALEALEQPVIDVTPSQVEKS
jgi:hypothetical protein